VDGKHGVVIGDLETTSEGIKRHGTHQTWLRNIVNDHWQSATGDPRHQRIRQVLEVSAGERAAVRLTEGQVLCEILDYCQRSTYYWAEEVPSGITAETDQSVARGTDTPTRKRIRAKRREETA
jgi:hypothetical protein